MWKELNNLVDFCQFVTNFVWFWFAHRIEKKYFIWRQWSLTFIHCFVIAIQRRQLSAKYICPKSKYRMVLQAVINDKISERSYCGIRICIYKPVRVLRKSLTGHCPELTLVSKVTEHNRIVTVEIYCPWAPTLVEHVLYRVKHGNITVMWSLCKNICNWFCVTCLAHLIVSYE